jgi:hypothetical protein
MRLDSIRELKAQLAPPEPRTAAGAYAAGLALGARPDPGGGYRLAVRVQDRALLRDTRLDEIDRAARGEVDVRYVGRIVAREAPGLQARHRPLIIGASVGHFRITAGTLGAFVTVSADDRPRILSNNHVLADEDRGAPGDAILQPGPADGGDDGDAVATLERAVRLRLDAPNAVDAALALVDPGIAIDERTLAGDGALAPGVVPPEDAAAVRKVGRTTGRTEGEVTAFELDGVAVTYGELGTLRFDDQVEIGGTGAGPFSQGGDSGSLIYDAATRRAVALLFAGGEEGGEDVTYGNPIGAVLDALDATLRP